jgi:hypothetical protein
MKKVMTIFGAIMIASTILLSCNSGVKEKDLVGQTFDLDTYHRIEFKTSTRYWIYQRPLSCGGEGNWSIQNDKIILGSNDSGCESTQGMKGTYEYSQLK